MAVFLTLSTRDCMRRRVRFGEWLAVFVVADNDTRSEDRI